MLAACCLAMAPSRGGRPRGGARAAKSAPVWQVAEQEWDHKAVQPAAKATGGRSRAARRQGFYDGLRAYAEHWQPLLQAEWDGEQQLLREQLEQWPRARLAREGLLLSRLRIRSDCGLANGLPLELDTDTTACVELTHGQIDDDGHEGQQDQYAYIGS